MGLLTCLSTNTSLPFGLNPFFQLVQTHQRLNRRHRVDIQLRHIALQPPLLLSPPLHLPLRRRHHFLRHARHPSDEQSVRLLTHAGLQPIRQQQRVLRRDGAHAVVLHAHVLLRVTHTPNAHRRQLRDGVVVRSEQRLAVDVVVEVLQHARRDRHALVHAGPAPQFVDENQRPTRRYGLHTRATRTVLQNRRCLRDLAEEGASVVHDVVRAAHTTEHLVHHADGRARRRHVAAHLREDHTQCDGAKVGGFPAFRGDFFRFLFRRSGVSFAQKIKNTHSFPPLCFCLYP